MLNLDVGDVTEEGQAVFARIWHIHDSQSQMMALAFKERPSTPIKVFFLQSEADLGESGTDKTVKARFRPWLSGEGPESLFSCSLLDRKQGAT